MLAKSLLLLASAALSASSPLAVRGADANAKTDCNAPHPQPQLPQTGADELPAPPNGVKLKYIALGLGIQNYSCADVGAAATATGALAVLYDVTNLYPGQGRQSLSSQDFTNLPHNALWNHPIPLKFDPSTEGRVDPKHLGADKTKPFLAPAPLVLKGLRPIPFLGQHFFDASGTPTFVLAGGSTKLAATKTDAVSAPANADKGPDGTGAVAWLKLAAKDGAGSVGAKFVYRVITAGGNSHGCTAAGQDSTSYAATYWFYD